jgi:fructose-1,6-bisphosphatase
MHAISSFGVQVAAPCSVAVSAPRILERILPIMQVHQRVPLFVGSKAEVEYLESFF